jgi:crotonobetainyl-CoA:carnitine CoA-transferase CaiB-like acyl-CoA transferase
LRQRTKQDWLVALTEAKVPCGPINNLAEVFADPHVEARGMVQPVPHPNSDTLALVASPIKMSGTPVRNDLPPPLLGQHTNAVLNHLLGLSDDDLAALHQQGVI